MSRGGLLEAIRSAAKKVEEKKEEKEKKTTDLGGDDDEEDDPELIQVRLNKWIGNADYSDVTFSLAGGATKIPAHRHILAARSPLFAAMLFGGFGEDASPLAREIEIKDTDVASFTLVLQSCYTDKPRVNAKQVIPAITAAKKYMVDTLAEACLDFMRNGLNSENACELFTNAPKDERSFALTYIEQHASEVLDSEAFLELAEPELCIIARSNHLSIDEISLFKALVNWGKKRLGGREAKTESGPDSLVFVLRNVIQHVRFPLMTVEDLATVVAPSRALDQHSLVELFTFLASTSKKKQIGRFCPFERQLFVASSAMKWDRKKSSGLTIHPDGLTLEAASKSCARFKYAQSDTAFPKIGNFYWEITISHVADCYAAIGVVNVKYQPSQRLGTNASSWAVRVYGPTTSQEQSGAWHANKYSDFSKVWSAGDRIGLLYNARMGHLSYYRNGAFIGTPFTNVKGDIFPCVEMCHLGTMRANFRAVPPKGTPKDK